MSEIENRTGIEPKTVYTLTSADVYAEPDHEDFLVVSPCEPHEDGTVNVCVMWEPTRFGATVFGENAEGQIIWQRDGDEVARNAVKEWLEREDKPIERAREHSRSHKFMVAE